MCSSASQARVLTSGGEPTKIPYAVLFGKQARTPVNPYAVLVGKQARTSVCTNAVLCGKQANS